MREVDGWRSSTSKSLATHAAGPAGSVTAITPGNFQAVKRADANMLVELHRGYFRTGESGR